MGTNYYWREKPCKCCGRFDELHIGKASAGWVFSWHGYRLCEPDRWGGDGTAPEITRLGIPLDTAARWTRFLLATGGTIWDEYGDQLSAGDFLEMVQAKRNENNLNRLSPAAREYYGGSQPSSDQVTDPLGDDVCFYHFS